MPQTLKGELQPSPYWPGPPHPKQQKALALFASGAVERVLYGGAAGGGKSELALMLATQHFSHPDWNVLMIASTWDQHRAGALGRLEDRLADDIDAGIIRHNRMHNTFRHKNGGMITFAIYPPDGRLHRKFGSSEYRCICIDEAGEIPTPGLQYFPTRLGRTDSPLPTCYLLTSNPMGESFLHLFETYYDAPQYPLSYYLPASLDDNPSISEAYIKNLESMPEPQRSQLRYGLWTVTGEGVLWTPETLKACRLPQMPCLTDMLDVCVSVDPSGGVQESGSECGIVVAGRHAVTGKIVVLADWSERLPVTQWPDRIAELARQYKTSRVVFERNFGGLLGPAMLRNAGEFGLYVVSVHTDRGKYERALPVSILYANGEVNHAPGLETLERHMSSFTPESIKRTDRIDAMVYAVLDVDGELGKVGSVEVLE